MTGIIGSGFGLYGYVPAVLENENNVLLPVQSKEEFLQRSDLQLYADKIVWIDNVPQILEKAETLIIAVQPKVQSLLIDQIVTHKNVKHLVLEKPLAANAHESQTSLRLLKESGKNFRINYSFLYCNWFDRIVQLLGQTEPCTEVMIDWTFKAHHYAHNLFNWKRFTDQGGGVINFYAIHLIAVAAFLNFNRVDSAEAEGISQNDLSLLSLVLTDEKNRVLRIGVDCNNEISQFSVCTKSRFSSQKIVLFQAQTPFDKSSNHEKTESRDIRVSQSEKIICEMKKSVISEEMLSRYAMTNNLWQKIEAQVIYQVLQ